MNLFISIIDQYVSQRTKDIFLNLNILKVLRNLYKFRELEKERKFDKIELGLGTYM